MDLSRIVILGAAGSIGSEVARQIVNEHGTVLLLGRSEEPLRSLANELSQPYSVLDFQDSGQLGDTLRRFIESDGPIHGVVNCIGSVLLKPGHLTTDQEFRTTLETNLFTSFAAIRGSVPHLREKGGSIVLFGSAAAQIGIANHEAIAAAKAGVVGLARSAAATYAANNIRVNVISPGLVRTNLTKRIWDSPTSAAASTQMHPLQRLGEPAQIARLVTWLLDPRNDWITGQVIGMDGGLGSLLPKR
jgi:3-oxoacyl-[acyl-carrier protein] reductase